MPRFPVNVPPRVAEAKISSSCQQEIRRKLARLHAKWKAATAMVNSQLSQLKNTLLIVTFYILKILLSLNKVIGMYVCTTSGRETQIFGTP